MRDVCNRKMGGKGNARNASAAELVASALVSTAVFIYRRGEVRVRNPVFDNYFRYNYMLEEVKTIPI